MDFFKRFLPNYLGSGRNAQSPNGLTEKDAAPVTPENMATADRTLQLRSPDNNHNYDNDTIMMESQRNADVQNTLNVHNANQQVNVQISNVSSVHLGSSINVNVGGTVSSEKKIRNAIEKKFNKKTRTIDTMMKSRAEPSHKMLDTVATHLGSGWKQVMRHLEFSEGQISQSELDNQVHGTKEIIYQLLLDWVNNADDEIRTLGYLTSILWNCGHRECVYRMRQTWREELDSQKS
ncbi:protein immune deficiency [Stomoxys calcitrans]|uniref:Death domain-containing protein n=1 Tax=Stomoxys calcitrans TaxID=35570 RepID=A0A1I8P8D1_STOCA|nr:protein immune deficiency [Stomoxys calcitrans]